MDATSWRTVFQVAIFLGSAIAGIGGIGVWYFGRQADAAKDAKGEADRQQPSQQLGNLQRGNQSLQQGNETLLKRLEPFEQLARERFPAAAPDQAMERLRRELTEVRGLATRDIPRPLKASIRDHVVANLKKLPQRPELVGLHLHNTSARNAAELIEQLEAILRDGGIRYQIITMTGMSMGLPAWAAYSVEYSPAAEAAAHQLADALAPIPGSPEEIQRRAESACGPG